MVNQRFSADSDSDSDGQGLAVGQLDFGRLEGFVGHPASRATGLEARGTEPVQPQPVQQAAISSATRQPPLPAPLHRLRCANPSSSALQQVSPAASVQPSPALLTQSTSTLQYCGLQNGLRVQGNDSAHHHTRQQQQQRQRQQQQLDEQHTSSPQQKSAALMPAAFPVAPTTMNAARQRLMQHELHMAGEAHSFYSQGMARQAEAQPHNGPVGLSHASSETINGTGMHFQEQKAQGAQPPAAPQRRPAPPGRSSKSALHHELIRFAQVSSADPFAGCCLSH